MDGEYSEKTTSQAENPTDSKEVSVFQLILRALYSAYFEPAKEPLHGFWRFVCAMLGSLVLIVTYIATLNSNLPADQIQFTNILGLITIENRGIYTIFVSFAFSIIFAVLIFFGYKNHRPVGYFMAGVILPAVVIGIAKTTAIS